MRVVPAALLMLSLAGWAGAQAAPAPAPAGPKISLDQAIRLALAHSPTVAAAQSQIPQSQAEEVTAGLRPNPVLSWDALYLPVFEPQHLTGSYLNNSAEFDAGVSYTFERGGKRQARLHAAQDATSVIRAQVQDTERGLEFAVAQQYVTALLAESTLAFAQQDLASWQNTVQLGQSQFRAGAISQGDLDTLQLQSLQYQEAVATARLARQQALTGLRQQIGFQAVPANFDVSGALAPPPPVTATLSQLEQLALAHRPDWIAAQRGVTAAGSQLQLARADGKRDLTAGANYMHTAGLNDLGVVFSIEIPVFDRNQGEIARSVAAQSQASDLQEQARQQVLTDVATALEAVDQGRQVVNFYSSGYRDQALQALTIRRYSFQRGASSLLDLLDAERTYRATELGYRQAVAADLLAVEQLKEAVGTRTLP